MAYSVKEKAQEKQKVAQEAQVTPDTTSPTGLCAGWGTQVWGGNMGRGRERSRP